MSWHIWWVWVAGGVLLGAAETMLPGFILLGFGLGAVATGLLILAGLLGSSLAATVLVFAVLSLVSWFLLRRAFPAQSGEAKIIRHDINEN